MLSAILTLALALSIPQQQAAPAPASPSAATVTDAQAKLHADALKLVETSGAREQLKAKLPAMVEQGKKAMVEKCPNCSAEFVDEWGKRMLSRMNVDDFVDVTVRAYEQHLSDEDIVGLIQFQEQRKQDPSAAPPAALKEKLTSVMPDLMADIMSGCVKVATKAGGEIGAELEKEHPEWVKAPAQQP